MSLTVKELIEKLQAEEVDQDLVVILEGCDCRGDASDICIFPEFLLIERED